MAVLFFFWHKRNGGGGWSVAAFCCGQGLAMNRLRDEACGIADGAVGAKSVTEKITLLVRVGGAAKIQRSLQQSVQSVR